MKHLSALAFAFIAIACQSPSHTNLRGGDSLSTRLAPQLPTGVRLDPAAPQVPIGPMPLTMRAAPGSDDRAVLLLSGFSQQGLQVVSTRTGGVLQTVPQPAAFVGLAF